MVVDGRVIPESLAILEYLESVRPEPALFPEVPGREAVRDAYERVNALLGPHLFKIARGTPEERQVAEGAVRAALEGLDAKVHDSGYLVGRFSVADLALASFVGKLAPGLRPSALGLPRLSRWEKLVMERPAVRGQAGPGAPAVPVAG